MKKRTFSAVLSLCLIWTLLSCAVSVWAAEPEAPIEIRTTEELLAMAENPSGSYILMADLDMTGVEWKTLDFSGSFDGNGHGILNLTVTAPSEEQVRIFDGNLKEYQANFAGFFGVLTKAEVKNLKLINLRALVETDVPCFLGGIAGYAKKSNITGCTLIGTLELRAHERMFGLGGLIGYGSGFIEDCDVDVTLICTDTDKDSPDEQFLGGLVGMGFVDVVNCSVKIDGYASEFGYAHNGGLIGNMMRYPIGDWTSSIKGNHVEGKITFFEKAPSRRAYCEAFVGEQMTYHCKMEDNTESFQRDERNEYDTELRPEMCADPVYTETVIAGGCDSYGYTRYGCESCGYIYTDHYTMFEHQPTEWVLQKAPTVEEEGLSTSTCACGQESFERTEDRLPPPPTEAPTEPPTEAPTEPPATEPPATEPPAEEKDPVILSPGLFILVGVAVLIIVLLIVFKPKKKKGKFHR